MAVDTTPIARPNGSAVRDRRVLPHNLECEASILGGVIIRNETLDVLGELAADDFYDHRHKVVYQAIRSLRATDKPIDVVTLENEIERVDREMGTEKLDAIGGIAFLGDLTLRVPSADNVIAYRDEVILHSRNRRAILELSSALERAWTWPHDPAELIAETTARLGRIEDLSKPTTKRLKLIGIGQALEDLDQLAKAPIYPTPFEALNDAIGFGGFLGTQVYTVAAGTGRGKTTWVAHVAAFAAQTVPVVVASYEMKPGYFIARKAAGVLGVHSNDIIRGHVSMGAVMSAVPYPRMFLMHKPSLRDLREAVDFVAQKFGTAPLLVVDYIQKLADEIALGQARPDLRIATSQASATLCDIGERTGAAVIAVSAIGRGKGRVMANPRKAQPYELVEVAKESGAVEYDGAAMVVLSLSDEMDGDERIATMTLAKVRFGEECHIDARYNGRSGTWRTLERVRSENKIQLPTIAPQEEGREDVVRKLIVAELQRRAARNKTDLLARIRGARKDVVREMFDAMWVDGSIAKVGLGIVLTEKGRQLVLEVTP